MPTTSRRRRSSSPARTRAGAAAVGVLCAVALAACSSSPSATTSTSGTTAHGSSTTQATHRAHGPSATSSPTTAATQTELSIGVQGTRTQIPWKSVGPGWLLATWSPNAASTQEPPPSTVPGTSDSLFLVDPTGGRYLDMTLPASTTGQLDGWSGNGDDALVTDYGSTAVTQRVIDLRSGSVVDSFSVPNTAAATFSEPDGLAVLLVASTGSTNTLERVSLSGTVQQTYPSTLGAAGAFSGSYLETPKGTQLLLVGNSGIAVVSNTGSVVSQLSVPGASGCDLARWWSTGVALASCTSAAGADQLWEVPVAGGAPSALTAPPVPPDLGDMTAYQVPSGTFVQDAGACGYVYLAKLTTAHTTAPVTVPGVTSGQSQYLIGTYQGDLALRATISCGPGVSALWYDPTSNTSTVVLGPPLNGGSVTGAVVYPRTTTP